MYSRSNGTNPFSKSATIPYELGLLITTVTELLNDENPRRAVEVLHKSRLNSPWVANAIAVCYLRLERPRIAIDICRTLILGAGGLILRHDAPSVFKTNYATALLLVNNVGGSLSILRELSEHDHPAVGRLQSTIAKSLGALTFWQRFLWYLGWKMKTPIPLNFPPGDLH